MLKCNRNNPHAATSAAAYRVGFTQETVLFGQAATKYIELRYFGRERSDYLDAVKFAKEICKYSGLNYLDDSQNERPF